MKKALIYLLLAVFTVTTMLPVTASARTVHVHAGPGGKHKKHRKHKKHHKRKGHRAKRHHKRKN
jgi:hypothetical protein